MKKKILVSLICFILFFNSFSIPVYAKEDYLSITLADIVITYFNATGVAIGETELFNGIQQLWGNVTLNDLVENDVLVAEGVNWTKDDIKNMIGYGNLSVPFVKVNQRNLKNYLGEVPISNVAHDALEAMFAFDSPVTEGIFTALAVILGDVANIGRMGYDLVSDVVLGFTDIFPISTLKQAYQKFTDSTYFQDLLGNGGGGSGPSPVPSGYEIISTGSPISTDIFENDRGFESAGLYTLPNDINNYGALVPRDTYVCVLYRPSKGKFTVYFLNALGSHSDVYFGRWQLNPQTGKYKFMQYSGGGYGFSGYYVYRNGTFNETEVSDIYGVSNSGCCIIVSSELIDRELFTPEFIQLYNPWNSQESPGGNGVTNYINNRVGNIASDNYINLSPNIGTNEYINIFDRIAYIENLNQIENNTDNGNYSQNSTVINNYNNQYIQNNIPTARPSTAPAQNPEEQPAQPFVSPRPTQAPEFVESVVQEGGLSSEITNKFPFCIPWDIKALIDNLWAPEARAPYIHWDAEFGSWGKLGEVDIDLSEYDDVARIFRSTTLLLWIVGLIVITRNLIG